MYLVNKPCATGRIVRWFVILLEFDFTVAVKKGSTHQRADHLSRIMTGESPTGVDDDLPDATLFAIEIAPRWARTIVTFLSMGTLSSDESDTMDIIEDSAPYQLISGRLYRMGVDGVMRICPDPDEYEDILQLVHVSFAGYHYSGLETARRARFEGYWWHNLYQDANDFVLRCPVCNWKFPPPFSPLFTIQMTPKWSHFIEEYLHQGH